eukprot:2175590-Prymnesium_polylepis.1
MAPILGKHLFFRHCTVPARSYTTFLSYICTVSLTYSTHHTPHIVPSTAQLRSPHLRPGARPHNVGTATPRPEAPRGKRL